MILSELIKTLGMKNQDLPMMVTFENKTDALFYVNLFGNSNYYPTIFLSNEKPIQLEKKSGVLLRELEIWRDDIKESLRKDYVYLSTVFEYEDDSYDFRFFHLVDVVQEDHFIRLVASSEESIELRDHHEAFDESMFDFDE